MKAGKGDSVPGLVLTRQQGEVPDGEPIKLDQVSISQISFTVGDVKALAAELESKGVQFAGPLDSFTNPQGDMRTIFVYDPDGILVQFDSYEGRLSA